MSDDKIVHEKDLTFHYRFDSSLMYLIQSITGKDSVDILAFFSDLTKAVVNVGLEKRKSSGAGIHKKIVDYFPNTVIPFFLEIKGNPRTTYQNKSEYKKTFNSSVEVKFPQETQHFPDDIVNKIADALLERDLLGGDGMRLQPFDKPESKSPRMYKKMMEEICGKQVKVKKEGYDPDITGLCRNCRSTPAATYRPCVCGGPNDPSV